MLITREVDYALRLVRALADGQVHKMERLCEEEMIPQQFAYKILKKLSKASLAESLRGREGGCRMTADLEHVTLYDLMNAMEADRRINACTCDGYQCEWVTAKGCYCGVNRKLREIQAKMDEELKAHTLASLLGDDL